MVDYCNFSERIFEFAFNAEFAARHASVLTACPSLPSLQAEKALGYDVLFELQRRGGGKESIFLQHKIPRFVTTRCGSNRHFFDFARGPYFAFRLDVAQYNLIHELATARKRKIYYCTPLYTSRRAIDDHFAKRRICKKAIWIDVAGTGPISDTETHTIVYNEDGARAALFSNEGTDLHILRPAEYKPPSKTNPRGFDWQEAKELYTDVYDQFEKWWPVHKRRTRPNVDLILDENEETALVPTSIEYRPDRLARSASRTQLIEATANLLSMFYGVTWFIITNNNEENGVPRSPS